MKTLLFYPCIFLLLASCGNPNAGTKSAQREGPNSKANTTPAAHVSSPKDKITKAYCCAIGEYIKAAYSNKPMPDTLFIGKNIDFPDMELPATIEKANILLLTSEEGQRKLDYRKELVYLNVMGWMDKELPEFLVVAFRNFSPQHNCSIFLKVNAAQNDYNLDSLHFEYPYGKQQKHEGDFYH